MALSVSPALNCVLGCNSPCSFAVHGNRAYIPADNGVVVVENGAEEYWTPSSAGKYVIDKIAASSAGILCLSEKRMSIQLHFFDAATRQQVCTVETDMRVEVASLAFSVQGDALYVLSTLPSATLSIFSVSNRGASVELMAKFSLPSNPSPVELAAGGGGTESPEVLVRYKEEIHGLSRGCARDSLDTHFVIKSGSIDTWAAGSDAVCFVTPERRACIFRYEDKTCRDLCSLPASVSATALTITETAALVGTGQGEVYIISFSGDAVQQLASLPAVTPIRRFHRVSSTHVTVGADAGLFAVELAAPESGDGCEVATLKCWRTSPTLKCLHLSKGSAGLVWATRDGSVFLNRDGYVTEVVKGDSTFSTLDACVLRGRQVVLLYDNALLRCFDVESGAEAWRHSCAECSPQFMATDGDRSVVCCGADTVRFLRCTDDSVADHGIVHATLLASIQLARWLPREAAVLAVCSNGDVFLVRLPQDGSADTAHAAEVLVGNSWRLEFPVTDALICFSSPEVVNLVAHSADHDTKVYALDRRYEGETKVSRPLFVMPDHASGGGTLGRLDESTVLSCGRDGRVVARDLTPYQTVLPPTPPSREKRKPLWTCAARSPFYGGITSVAVSGDAARLLCGGRDAVLHCLSLHRDNARQGAWLAPVWNIAGSAAASTEATNGEKLCSSVAAPERAALQSALEQVRASWAAVMAAKDADVPLAALMTEEQRAAFGAECESAVQGMQEHQYYHSLLNDYLQDTIKRRCCDSMAVPRMKVASMNVPGLQVHNFHLHHALKAESSLSRKALLLRQLQARIQGGRRTSIDVPSGMLPDPNAGVSTQYATALLPEPDVYTQSRMAVQTLLVKGHTLTLKERFNAVFDDLQAMKKHTAAQMEERTLRCVAIGKQLDEAPAPMYTPIVDAEEDPESLFRVDDKELGPGAQALSAPLESAAVVSADNEAALHLWMDGLEREVERLEVDVPLPEFADESRDTFVPPEERTEEQLRALDAYARTLKEEQERVNARKEALRSEFKALQASNVAAAAKVDEELEKVRQSRLNVVEAVDEAELQLTLLFKHRLGTANAHRQHRLCASRIQSLRAELVGAQSQLAVLENGCASARDQHDGVAGRMSEYAASASTAYPFNDGAAGERLHRRFVRWQRRFEDGKAPLPEAGAPVPDCDAEQWAAFCEHCGAVAKIQNILLAATAELQRTTDELADAQRQCDAIEEQVAALQEEMLAVRDRSVVDCLDTRMLCRLHQGQIQDEGTTTCTAFATAKLRWCSDVTQYNDLIIASDAESRALLERATQRRKLKKVLEWEKEKLQYDAGSLQMELRQLHTLRVTRQMQEWINGDAGVSEEKRLAGIQRHMELVEANMGRKVEDLRAVAQRLKRQIAERATENVIVGHQVGEIGSAVRDSAAVYELIDTRADGASTYKARAKEIFATSELEELARSQQEELVRLKREVDRLRERTFPSFAVVSKQTR